MVGAPAGAAEQYPVRPVRIIIPSGAGGITDILGRVIAPKLTEGLGQQWSTTGPGLAASPARPSSRRRPRTAEQVPRALARGRDPGAGCSVPVNLHREIVKVVHSPEFTQVLTTEGATAVGSTPAEFDAIIRDDVKKWAKIVKDAGLRGE